MGATSAAGARGNGAVVLPKRFLSSGSWRDGVVQVTIVPDVTTQTLLDLTVRNLREVSVVCPYKLKHYDSLMCYGYRNLNVDYRERFFSVKVRINGLEKRWNWAKEHFPLYLKEL